MGKVSQEQLSGGWQDGGTDLANLSFASGAWLCRGQGPKLFKAEQFEAALGSALNDCGRPLVEIVTDAASV